MNEKMFKDKIKSCKELLLLQNTSMTNILEKRYIFERFGAIIKSNPSLHTHNVFWDWYLINYIDSQIMELCRILDKDKNSKNLIRFLESLESGFSIDDSFFEKIRDKILKKETCRELAETLLPLFDVDSIKSDIEKLQNEVIILSVKNYRDHKIAHNEFQKWDRLDLDFKKLNECIDFVHKKILSYEVSLNGHGYSERGLLPVISYN